MRRLILLLTLTLFVAGCAVYTRHQLDQLYGEADPARFDRPRAAEASPVDWQAVKSVFDSRCVVCHGCYDAPCQLQLGSFEGIARGASKSLVYDAVRRRAAAPTRLFVDAHSNAAWRTKGFHPVLNEREPSAAANLEGGVMARLLRLKGAHEYPTSGPLPGARYDFGLDRKQSCPTAEEFDRFAEDHPHWGMPYGLPPLVDKEQRTLLRWLEAGAPAPASVPLSQAHSERIARWEAFLNGSTLKSRLMSRYIFEHWFLAHFHFDDLPAGDFFELVRSKTPPGEAIDLIATRRPFDDPGVPRVYYRLRPVQGTLVAKTHMPYALNDARMARIKAWFIDAPYAVSELPSYEPKVAANPFVAFRQLPVRSRYRLMLDEAHFTITGFIKGPVCRGQVALDVITDHFWIGFIHPDREDTDMNSAFLATALEEVQLPIEQQSDARLLKWQKYAQQQTDFLRAKSEWMNKAFGGQKRTDLSLLWDGDGANPNAALTVFRHFDSASVVQGLVGEQPQSALLIGYPLLERIHYLLVAGFDVYGNTAHQLEARLYMDFLRMEGELNVLALLPANARNAVRDRWYRGASEDTKAYLNGSKAYFAQETGIAYKTGQPWPELQGLWKGRLAPVLGERYALGGSRLGQPHLDVLRRLASLKGRAVSLLPEVTFLSVRDAQGRDHQFTLLRNSAHSNISELFGEEDRRLPDEDTLTVVNGFLGAYPNAFYLVQADRLPDLLGAVEQLKSEADYATLASRFAIRRTDARFWSHSDALHAAYRRSSPVEAGLFDYNRYENR